MKRLHLVISGRVQGVGFRYFCYEEAQRLGLTGYARNRPDGTVEAEVQGEEEALHAFKKAVEKGPRAARVSEIQNNEIEVQTNEKAFSIS